MNKFVFTNWFDKQRGKYIDVIIAGRIFGGRHGESPQTPQAYQLDGDHLCIKFATTETLTVFAPSDFTLGQYAQLIIPNVSRTVFGWHYYGREQTPENWCEEIYEFKNNVVKCTRTGPLMPGIEKFNYTEKKFVELL